MESAQFEPTLCNDYLYRGVADMKGSLGDGDCLRALPSKPQNSLVA